MPHFEDERAKYAKGYAGSIPVYAEQAIGGGQSATPPSIPDRLAEVEKMLARTFDGLLTLESRLQPVCRIDGRIETPIPGVEGPRDLTRPMPSDGRGALGIRLSDIYRSLEMMNNRMERLYSALEI